MGRERRLALHLQRIRGWFDAMNGAVLVANHAWSAGHLIYWG